MKYVAVLIPTDRQAVSMFEPELRSTSICRSSFRISSSENRFLAIINHPQKLETYAKTWPNFRGQGHPLSFLASDTSMPPYVAFHE